MWNAIVVAIDSFRIDVTPNRAILDTSDVGSNIRNTAQRQ